MGRAWKATWWGRGRKLRAIWALNGSMFMCIVRKHFSVSGEEILTTCSPVVPTRTARIGVQKFYVLPTQCVYVFCVDLRTNSDYFPIQH
jgi:hypothetical protein